MRRRSAWNGVECVRSDGYIFGLPPPPQTPMLSYTMESGLRFEAHFDAKEIYVLNAYSRWEIGAMYIIL